jgi:MFS family permease
MSALTLTQKKLSQRFLVYSFFSSLFFVGAVWLYFYRIFLTDYQVGVLDALAFFIGICAEVPSGALADRYGRDKLVRLGQLLMAIGLTLQAIGGMTAIFIGQVLLVVGVAFSSGADEALFFSRLQFPKDSPHWRKLMTRSSQMALMAALTAVLIGAWVYEINIYVPWFLSASAMTISALVIWGVKDERLPRERGASFQVSFQRYVKEVYMGFKLFVGPKLWMYVPLIFALQGLYYAAGWGLLRLVLLDRFHFSPFAGALVIAISGVVTVLILSLLHRYAEKVREKEMLSSMAILTMLALVSSVFDIGFWGAIVIFVLYASSHIIGPFISEIVNHNVPEENRATALSVAAFFKSVPYLALAPVIGFLNTKGNLEYFLVGWVIVIALALAIYLFNKNRDDSHSVFKEEYEF